MKGLNVKIIIYLFVVAILSCSCASKKHKINYAQQSIFIEPGMNKQEVVDIMGYPGNRQYLGDNEAWQYHRNGFWGGYDIVYIIWFYKGIVTGQNSQNMPTTGSAVYPMIRWEERPNDIIEIRHR